MSSVVIIAFGVILLVVMLYIYIKDAENSRQVRSVAGAIDQLQQELHKNRKSFETRLAQRLDEEAEKHKVHLERELNTQFKEMAEPIAQMIEEVQNRYDHSKAEIDMRLASIEEGLKNLTMPMSSNMVDDNKIIAMFQQGIPTDIISKDLRISKHEVEFALKLAKLRE